MHKTPKLPGQTDFEVGYGKPPKTSQFKKGRSGNPKGRPKGARNKPARQMVKLRDMLISEGHREITVQDKSGPLSMPVAQAAIRSLSLKAAQGVTSAQKLFLQSLAHAENEQQEEALMAYEALLTYKQRAYEKIEYHKKHNIPLEDDILPHPDHIVTNTRTGEVIFTGPIDESDKAIWDELWARKADYEEEIDYLKNYENTEGPNKIITFDIEHAYFLLSITEQAIMMCWHRSAEDVVKDWRRRAEVKDRVKRGVWPEKPHYDYT